MILIESHIIKKSNELDILCNNTKNLYNRANYLIRQEFINNGHYISKFDMFTLLKNDEDYNKLLTRVARPVLRTLDGNWKSFFSCMKKWSSNKSLFNGRPNLPKYLPKNGKFIALFIDNSVNKKYLDRGILKLSRLDLEIKTKLTKNDKIVEVQIIPLKCGKYKINICYDYKEEKLKSNNKRYCSVDLGVNNLMTLTSNDGKLNPIIINGSPLKSINQYYNKKRSKIQSELPTKIYSSSKLDRLTYKRERKIDDYLHKASHLVVNYCVENNLNTLIVGYNKNWKKSISIGKKNNQNFVSIPFYKLISMLEYKCMKMGINFTTHEESYTSKCSFIDNEEVKKHKIYLGKRIKRGLYQSNVGLSINADVNASFNILRKVVPDVRWDRGCAVHPQKSKTSNGGIFIK